MSNPSLFPVQTHEIGYVTVSCVIVNDAGETLLFMRDDMPLWTNIGGYLDEGETFLDALHRETFEETGCKIVIEQFVGDFFSPYPNGQYCHEQVYLCRLQDNNVPSIQDNEGVKLRWFAADALPVNMGPRFHKRIQCALSRHPEPLVMITPDHNMLQFLQHTTDFSNFVDLDEWNRHPNVMRKRAAGTLKFDPFSL